MQLPDHLQRKFSFPVQDLARTALQAYDPSQVILRVTKLLHPEFDRLDRIGIVDRIMFFLVFVDQHAEDLQFITFWRSGFCIEDRFKPLQGGLVIFFRLDGFDLHFSDRCGIYAIVLSVSSYEPDPNHAIVVVDLHDQSVFVAFDVEHDAIIRDDRG